MFIGAVLGIVILVVLDIVSTALIGQRLSYLIFGNSGLQLIVAIMGGCILGFILGNKARDRREQARIKPRT